MLWRDQVSCGETVLCCGETRLAVERLCYAVERLDDALLCLLCTL